MEESVAGPLVVTALLVLALVWCCVEAIVAPRGVWTRRMHARGWAFRDGPPEPSDDALLAIRIWGAVVLLVLAGLVAWVVANL